MKKIIIGSIVFCVFFIFTTTFTYSQRSASLVIKKNPFPAGLIYIKGEVRYRQNEYEPADLEDSNTEVTSTIYCKLKNNLKYEIHSIKLNDRKYALLNNFKYTLTGKRHHVCTVGEIFKLKIALKEKGNFRVIQKVRYYTIGTFKVKNLIKNYIYPTQGQVVDLKQPFTPFLTFKWKYTNFPQPARVVIKILPNQVTIKRNVTGEKLSIRKSLFPINATVASVHHYTLTRGKNTKFKFSEAVAKESKMSFTNDYHFIFTIAKQVLKKAEISIK